jgi:hypothetical protein
MIKKFIDLFVGLLSNVNNSSLQSSYEVYILLSSSISLVFLCKKGQQGVMPYLLRDESYPLLYYPLLYWLMSLHRDGEQNILEMLFNKKHKQD